MNGALPEARYPLIKIVPANIAVFNSRADYQAKRGEEAPLPNLDRPWKWWTDMAAKGQRHASYWFLDLQENGDVARDSGERPKLYLDSLSETEAVAINLPPTEIFSKEEGQRVAQNPTIPLPVRQLFDDEDIGKDPLNRQLFVINVNLWGKQPAATDEKLFTVVDEIRRSVIRIESNIDQLSVMITRMTQK